MTIVNYNASGVATSQDDWNATSGSDTITLYSPAGVILSSYDYLADGNVTVTDYAPDGATITDQQTIAAGLAVNPDGSDFSRIMNADNSYTLYYQNGQGDTTAWQYSAANQPEWASVLAA